MEDDSGRPKATLKLASLLLLLIKSHAIAVTPGIIHVNSEKGGDYCFLFPSQWMTPSNKDHAQRLDLELATQNLTYSAMCCLPSFLGEADSDGGGFSTRIASVREGNCNLYENGRIRPINRTRGLLTLGGDAPYFTAGQRSGYKWGRCEEITVPGILLSDGEVFYLLSKNLFRDFLYRAGVVYLLSMTIVIVGSYWAGNVERRKQQNTESESQTEDNFAEVTTDFTSTCTGMATSILLTLYCIYDYLAHVLTGIFSLYSSFSLYSCLTPFVNQIPFGEHAIRLPYFHKCLEIRRLLLAGLCLSVNAAWVIFRKDEKWGWVLQDVLGISVSIYILRTVHMPNLKTCSLFLFVHLFSGTLCADLAFFLTKSGRSDTSTTAFASLNSEEMPFLLKVPTVSSSPDLDGTTFTVVSLGDIVLPGLLVAHCHRFDVQVESSGIYFLASALAYSCGLLAKFTVATFVPTSQSTLPYLVPGILIASLTVAACRKEITIFWTGVGSADNMSQPPSLRGSYADMQESETQLCQQGGGKEINVALDEEDLNSSGIYRDKLSELKIHSEEVTN